LMLERCHQLWTPRLCQSALDSQNLLFGRLRWLQSVQIQLIAGVTTRTASADPVTLPGIKASSLDKSATNANQGCFAACAYMIKKDGKQYSERDNISSEKKK